jgi:hypothetical protein
MDLGTVHALDEARGSQVVAVRIGGIFDAAITVEDQTRLWSALVDRQAQRPQSQADVTASSQCPGQHAPGMFVEDDSEVTPLGSDLEVRHVAHPDPIGCIGQDLELAIGYGSEEGFDPGSRLTTVGSMRSKALVPHDPGHSLLAEPLTHGQQRTMHARAAVVALVGLKDPANMVSAAAHRAPPGRSADASTRHRNHLG